MVNGFTAANEVRKEVGYYSEQASKHSKIAKAAWMLGLTEELRQPTEARGHMRSVTASLARDTLNMSQR